MTAKLSGCGRERRAEDQVAVRCLLDGVVQSRPPTTDRTAALGRVRGLADAFEKGEVVFQSLPEHHADLLLAAISFRERYPSSDWRPIAAEWRKTRLVKGQRGDG